MTFTHEPNRTGHAPIALAGHAVVDPRMAKVGTVTDVLFDDRAAEPRWAVVKTGVLSGEHLVPLDKNDVKRVGDDITICAHSRMLVVAQEAAAELEKEGISAEIVDMRALRPLDMAPVIESVKKTSRLITVEEGWRSYGVGAEIASRVYEEAFDYLDAPVARIGAAEVPAPYNKALEKIAFPGKADVIVTARALLGKN